MNDQTYNQAQLSMMHLAAGRFAQILKEQPVEHGQHKVGKRRMVIDFDSESAVIRDVGRGDGITEEPVKLKITDGARMLFIDRARHNPPSSLEECVELWRQCILDDRKGHETPEQAEALKALAMVQADVDQAGEMHECKTPAKRFGEKRIKISFAKADPKKAVTVKKRRKLAVA